MDTTQQVIMPEDELLKPKRFVLSKTIGLQLIEGNINDLQKFNEAAIYIYNLYYTYHFLQAERFRYLTKPFAGKKIKAGEEVIAPFREESITTWQQTGIEQKIDEVLQQDLPERFYNDAFLKPIKNAIRKSFDFEKNKLQFEKYPSSLHKKFVPLYFDVTPATIQDYFSVTENVPGQQEFKKQKVKSKHLLLKVFGCTFYIKFSKQGSKAHDILLHMMEHGDAQYRILSSALRLAGKDRVSLMLHYEQLQQFTDVSYPDKNIILGIDLGINYPAFGAIYPNKIFKSFGHREEYHNKKLQFRLRKEHLSRITHNSTVQENKLRTAVGNFKTDYNHKLAKEIIDYAKEHNAGTIHLEKLQFYPKFKNNNLFLKDWDFAQLRDFITYKARHEHITVKLVSPRFTSQMCSEFGSHNYRHNKNFIAYELKSKKKFENIFWCSQPCKHHFELFDRQINLPKEKCPACGVYKKPFRLLEKVKGGGTKTWYTAVCQNDKIKQPDGALVKCKDYYHFRKRDENAALNIAKQHIQQQNKKHEKRNKR